ncbi:MAG: aminotransferase class I/II-fold pyridoxal phosphate-dependent enzyme, partial [Mucilaginibacter sp.]
HGAIVLGSDLLREYLINFSRSFIYTTAASFHQIAAVKMAYKMLPLAENEIQNLQFNIHRFKDCFTNTEFNLLPSDSAIQCLVTGSNEQARQMAQQLQDAGFDIRPILSPTVPKGTERLRICLHSYNMDNEIILLAETISKLSYA